MDHCHIEHQGRHLKAYFLGNHETYRLGDVCPWEPDFAWPGKWVNGVHAAHDQEREYWIVVRQQRLIDVTPYVPHETMDVLHQIACLERDYQIPAPPPELWPPQSWQYFNQLQQRHHLAQDDLARARQELAISQPQNHLDTSAAELNAIELRDKQLLELTINGIRVITRKRPPCPSLGRDQFADYQQLECPADIAQSLREFDGWRWTDRMLCAAVQHHVRERLVSTNRWPAALGVPVIHVDLQAGDIAVKIYLLPPLVPQP